MASGRAWRGSWWAVVGAVVLGIGVSASAGEEPGRGERLPRSMPRHEDVLANLRGERELAIARLREYRLAREFPVGATGSLAPDDPHAAEGRVHTFVGPNGARCALAHLIATSGRRDILERVARDDNGLCVGTTTDPHVLLWVLGSGLTLEECVRIQEPGFDEYEPAFDPIEAIAAHLEQVEAELVAGTDASLCVAVERWLQHDARSAEPVER